MAGKARAELRREAAELIKQNARALGVKRAAQDLGVTRQAVYDILKGKSWPSFELIERACAVWGLEFTFRGLHVDKGTLQQPRARPTLHMQTTLFNALELLESRHLDVVKAKRIGSAVELVLRLTLPA